MISYRIIFTLFIGLFSINQSFAQCPIPASAVAFTASSNNICAQTDVTFTVTNPDPNYTYTWDFGDAASSSNTAGGSVVTHAFSPTGSAVNYNVTVTATPSPSTIQAASWTNIDPDLTAVGNSLFRNAGSGSGYNAGAESNQSITDDMYMEFTAGPTNNRLIAGLGAGDIGNDGLGSIDYGIETRNDGSIRIYESGSNRGSFGSYQYGDTMRVAVEGGTVRYYRNGALFYTSGVAPSLPMFVDLSIRNENDTLHNVTVGYLCTASSSTTISTLATPNIDITGTWDRCIAVDNLGFTNTIFQINNPSGVYTWDFGDGSAQVTTANPVLTHTYTTHGVYTVTVTQTSGGCTGTYTNQVRYLERPLANMVVVGTADICEGETIYVANNTDTVNLDFFVLDWGDGTLDTVTHTDTLSHIYTFSDAYACTISQGGQPYVITLYAVNACFEHTNSSPITVTATPRADFSAPSIVCEAVNNTSGVQLSSSICPAPPDIFSDLNNYIWDFGDPASGGQNTSTFSTPTHFFSGPGDYTVTVELIGNCGTYRDTMNVRILDDPDASYSFTANPAPTSTVNGDGCSPIDVDFNNTSTGDSMTYAWTLQTNIIGGYNFINGTSDTSTNPQINFNQPGEYIVTLTATNPCTSNVFIDTIRVLEGPTVVLGSASPTCDTFSYTPNVTYGEGGGAIDTYTWSFPGATPATSNAVNPTNILYTSSGTYQVIVQIQNECTIASDTISFYVPMTPTPITLSANGNQNTCIDAAAFNLSADSTGGSWSGVGITNATNGTFNPAVAGLGTHTITYTYQPRDCPAEATIQITVNDLPNVSAGSNQALCLNDGLLTLTGGMPVGGTWSGTGVTDGAAGIFDPTVSDVGVFPVTYTYTDGNGCENFDVKNVRVRALPSLNLGNDLTECNGPDDITLSAAPSGGTWSGMGITDTNAGTFNTITAGGLGTYKAYYDYTDANGCSNRDSINIDVITGTAVDAGRDTTLCVSGNTLVLDRESPTGGVWIGAGVVNTGTNYTFYPSIAGLGTHNIIYSLGTGSCEERDTFIATVINIPTVEAGSDLALCISEPTFNLTGNSPAGGTWSGTGITDVNAGTFNPATGAGTYILSYSYIDPVTECVNTDTRQIIINDLPTVITTGVLTECNNTDNLQLTGFSPNGGTWTGSGITNASTGVFNSVTAGGLGINNSDTTYQLTYTYTDGNGCIDSSKTSITLIFGDVVEAGPNDTLCINNGSYTLTGFSPAGGTWTGNGVAGTSFFPAAAGLGLHTLTYTYGSGSCQKEDTKTVLVIDIPTINAGNDTLVCFNTGSFTLVPFSPIGGTWSGTGVTGDTFTPATAGTGVHVLTYTYINTTTGCENTDQKAVTVSAVPAVTTLDNQSECITPDNIILTNYSPAGGTWSGTGIVDVNNGIFNGTTAGGVGMYDLVYSYTDGNGCTNTDTLAMDVVNALVVEAGDRDTVCQYDPAFNLTGYSPAGGTWIGSGITNTNTGEFNPGAVAPGTHTLIYAVGSGTCERFDTTYVLVGATPVVNAGADTLVCEGTSTFTLYNFSPVGGTWTGTGITGNTFDPITAGTGVHVLTYTYIDPVTDCQNSDTKNVTVSTLPNVITTGPVQECTSPDNITLTGYSPLGGVWSGTGIVDNNNGIFNGESAGGTGVYQLTYTYTDNNGCINADTMQLSVVDSVSVNAGFLDTVCQYDTPFVLNGFSPAGGIWSGSGISNANTGQFNPGSVAPGNYQVIYTIGSGTCERSDTTSILIVPTPNVEAGPNLSLCIDSSAFVLPGFSPAGGIWSGTGIIDSLTGRFDPATAAAGTHTLTYTYTESINGCFNSDTRTVTVNELPTITMPDTSIYCNSGGDITLSGYNPTGGLWSGTGIVDANNGVFNTVTAGGIGDYTLYYQYTDGNSCVNYDTTVLQIVFGDTINAGPDLAMCITDNSDTLTGYIPTASGTWSGAGIINASLGVFDPATAGVGSHTIIYFHGTGTCLKQDSREILVGAVPTVQAGVNLEYCINDNQDTLTGNSPLNGIWTGTGITDTLNGYFNPVAAGTGIHTITYTYTNSITGCENSDTRTLRVNGLPVISTGDSVTYCNNSDNITLAGYSPLGGTWSGPGIVDASNGVFNTTVAGGEGSYNVFYTVTNGSGCTDMDTLVIDVIYGDTVRAGGPYGVCIDDGLVTLSGYTPTSGGTWSGAGIVDAANGIFDPTAVTSNTLITITYTYGVGTCQKTDQTTIYVGTIPPVEAGNNQTVCSADAAFTFTGFVPSTGGIWSGAGITNATTGEFDPSVAGAGTHTLTYYFIDNFTGCENSDTKLVTVLPAPTVSAGQDQVECNSANNITLAGYSPLGGVWSGQGIISANNGIFNSIIAGGEGAYTLTYTYIDSIGCTNFDDMTMGVIYGDTVKAGDNFNVCLDNGIVSLTGSPAGGTWSGSGITNPNGTFDPTVSGTGTHTLTYTYGTGTCQKTDDVDVFVSPIIAVNAGPDLTVCILNGSFILTGSSPSNGGTWSGTGVTGDTFDPVTAGVGIHTITYNYVNAITGCTGSDTRTIEVIGVPVVNAGGTEVYCNSANDITLTGYSPSGGTWSGPGIVDASNGIFNANAAGGLSFDGSDTTYTLTYSYTGAAGCAATSDLIVTVEFGDTVSAGPNQNTCLDAGFLTLTGHSPAGGAWSGTGIIDPNGVFDPSIALTGTHTLTYTYGTGSCQKTDTKDVFVSPIIVVDAGADEVICSYENAFNLAGYSPSSGGSWSGTGITDATNGTFDPQIAGVGTHILTYFYANPVTGCEGTDTKIIQIVTPPTAEAGGPVSYCYTTADITLGGYSPAGGVWSGAGIVDASNGIFNAISAGGLGYNDGDTIYTLTYTYTDGNGCIDSDDLLVTIIYGDTVEAGPDFNICVTAGFQTLTGFSPAGGTWSGTGVIDPSGIFDPATSGSGNFVLTYTYGVETCLKTDTRTVFVSPDIPVEAGADLVLCEGSDTILLTGNSPSSGVWSGTGIVDGNTGAFDPVTSGIGSFTITYFYSNAVTGCSGSDTRTVDVIAPPVVEAGAAVVYCNTTNNQTLTGFSPQGGTWSGAGIVDPAGVFNPTAAGGLGLNDADTTYYVVYTYGIGTVCEGTDTLPVTVIFGDVVDAGPNDTLCIDDAPLVLSGNTPAVGGTWTGAGITDGVNGIFDPSVAGAGIHTLTYTHGTGSCLKTSTKTILVGALPVINPGPDENVCIDNGSFILNGFSPQGGTWTGTGITDGNTATFDPSVSGIGTFTLTYTYFTVLGCDSSVTKTVTVSPLPTVTSPDTVVYCDNPDDITLTGYFPTTGGSWSGPGIVNATQGLFNTNIAGGIGNYTLVYSYTDGNGCTNTDTTIAAIIFGDTVEAGANIALCISDGLVNMTGFSPFGGSWSGPGIVDAQNGTFDPSQAATGLHTLTYTYGTGSCQKTDTKTVFVGPIPAVTAGNDIDVCQQDAAFTLSGASPSGGTWAGAGVDAAGLFTPSSLGAGTYTLTYTYTNSVTGCSNSDQVDVTVIAPPAVDAGGPITYCNTNQNITLTGYTPAGGLWNGPGIIDGINGVFNVQSAGGVGTYKIAYTFTNTVGCFNRDTLEINIIFGDTVEAGIPDTLCIDNGIFVLSGYSPVNGTWTGTGITDGALGIFDPAIAGTGTHVLTYTFGTGTCLKTDTKTIFVDGLPVVSAGVDQTICIDNGAFNLTGYTPQGGTWTGVGITDGAAGTFDPVVAGIGTFTMTYTYASPITGCANSDTKVISVVPLPVVATGSDVVYCNTPNQISLSPASPSGGVWSGNGIVDANNGIFSTVLAGGLGYNDGDTSYYVVYTYTDGNNCANSDSLKIDVIFGDTVLAGTNESICIDAGLITLSGFSPAGGTWSGNGITDPAGIFDPTAAGLGSHTLTYTFGTGTCLKTATKTIFVGAPPTISAGVDQTICIDNGAFLISGYSPLGGFWTGSGVDSTGIFTPSSVGVGTYTLTYTFVNSVTGCEASDTKTITIAPLPTITTADTVIYCDIPNNITLTGYTPAGGTWSGNGIVDANAGVFNTTQAGGLAFNGGDTTYTLTYTYTDANGCSNNEDLSVTVTYGDTVLAGTNEATCIDAGLLNLGGFTPAGGMWSGNGIIDAIVGIFDPQAAGVGTHVLTYTFGSGTCEKEATKTITVGDDPLVDAGTDLTVCIDNGQILFNNYSPLGGTWSGVGVIDAANGIFDPAVSGQGTYTITYSFTNSVTGCEASDTRLMTINPLPVIATTDTIEYCDAGVDIALTGYSPTGGVWSGTGVVDGANGIFNTNIAGGVGTYDLTYSYTDANGCENTGTTVINVIFGDTVEAGPNLAICISDAPISFTGFSPAAGTWTGDGIINAGGTFDPQVAGLGLHTLTYTFGTGTCLKTDTRTVFVGDIPTVTAGADETVCEQESPFNLTGFSPAGGIWAGVGITDAAGVFDPGTAGVGVFTLTYTYTNATTGCFNTDTKEITVLAPPIVEAGGPVTYCNTNQNIILNGYTPAGGIWTGPGIVDALNGVFNTTSAGGEGNYQLVYQYTNATGCFNADTLEISVIFGDTVVAGLPDTICIDNGILTLAGYSPAGGTWSGTGVVDTALGLFNPLISGTGTHLLTYTYGVGTCRKSDTKTVFVDALPIVSAGPDESLCIDNPSFNLTGNSPQGGVWTGVGITDTNLGTFDPAIAGVGTWTLTYTYVKPSTGCENTDTKTITINALPTVSAGNDVVYCNTPNQITLPAASPVGGLWSGNGIVDATAGGFSTVVAGGLGYNGGDTTYAVVYTFTDANGCVNDDTMEISVIFGDTVLAGTNQSICIDIGLITFTDFSPAGGTWSGNGITDPAGVFDPTAAGLGSHVLTYTFGTGTCEKTATKTIFVGAPPTISAGVDQTVCIDNGAFLLSGYSPLGGFWTGSGVDSSGIFTPSSVGIGTYTLTYTFVNSVTDCEASDTKTITVAPLPTVTTTNTVLYCDIPNNITLTGYTPSGGVWSGNGIVDANAGIFNTTQAGGLAFNGGDTTYTLTYTYTDINGCSNNEDLLVTVTYGDTVLAGTNEAICIDAGLLNLAGFTPSGGIWSGSGIVDANAGVFDPQAAGIGTHVLTYTYGGGTCEKQATKTIFVGDNPIVEAGPNLEYCIDEGQFQLTNYSPLGGTWSGVGISDATNGFYSPALAGAGTHVLTYSYTNSITGCTASDTRTVIINPLPVVIAPDTLEYCNTNVNISFSGFSPLGGTWLGTGVVDGTNGIFNTQIAGGEGTYLVEYRYTDVNGCTNSDTTIIEVIFGDTVEAGPDLAVCIADAPFLLTGFQPVGGTWTGAGITDPSGVFDPQAAGAGLHVITFSFGTGTCLKTDTREIFVGEVPTVSAGPDDAVCGEDAPFQLAGFSPPGGFFVGVGVDSAGMFDPVLATPGTWTLTYTYVNPITGCSNTDTKEVFVETPPAVDAGGLVTYCNSTNNITLANYTPTGGVWAGDGIVDGLNGIFNTSVAGGLGYNGLDTTYRVVYSYTSSNGCFGRDTLDIVVEFGDTVYAGVDDTVCIDAGQFNLVGASPAGGTWSGTGIIDAVLGTYDPAVAGAGLHILAYTYGIGTCEKTDYKTVFVGALPLVDAGNNELVCVDEPIFTLANFSPQGGYWVGVGIDSIGNFDATLAGVGTWTLTYTFVNSITGCDNFDTKEITVAPLPQVNVGDTVQYCDTPSDITLSGYSPAGGTWSGNGIVSANSGIFSTVLAGGIGVYDIEYDYTDNNGCSNKDTLVIDVIFGDTVYAGTQVNMCIDDGIITLNGYTPPTGGSWSGPGIVDPSAGTFDPILAGGGLHVLTYTFGNGTCEKTSTRTVFVGTPPVVDAGADMTVCEDQTAFLLPSFSPSSGVWIGTGITDAGGIFDPQVTGVGTFTLTYTFTNALTGCENFDTRVIEIVPLPVVNIDDSLEFCLNNNNIPLTLYVNTTPTTGLTWSGVGIVDPANGVFNANIAGGIGLYNIEVLYTDGNSCTNRDTLVVDVIYGDTVEAGPSDTLCINDNAILLTGFSPAGGTWTGSGIDQASGTFDPAIAGVGVHVITYTYGTGTCEKTDTRTFTVGALPSISIGPDQTLCIDATAFTLSAYSPQGGTWTGVGITDGNVGIFDPQVAEVGTHILTYTFANSITGCENTAQRTITVAPLPVVDAGDTLLICDNPNDYTLTNYFPSGGTWSGQGVVNASAGVINTIIAGGIGQDNGDTTYFFTYSYTDGNACTNRDTLVVDVEFGDSIEAGPNEALCIDIGLHQLTGFLPTVNGIWSGPGIVDAINGIFDPQAAGAGPHTLTITTGVGTCAKSDTKIIFVGTPPVVNPGNDEALCEDETAFTLVGFSPPNGVWAGVGITDSLNAVFDPQVAGVGTHVLTYTFVNGVTNCETVATKTVTVNPLPFVDAGDTITYCDNPNDIVLGNYTPGAGGFWSGPGIVNPSQGIFNTVTAGGIDVYHLAYDYTDPFTGCRNSDTLVVDVIFGDTVVAGPNDTVCVDNLPFTLSGSPASGVWTGAGITNGNLGIFNPAVAGGGTHILTYTFGIGTCEKTDTKIIFVGLPDPLDGGNDQVVCVDAPPFGLVASEADVVWSGNGIVDQVGGIFDPATAQVGIHNIIVNFQNTTTGCISRDTIVIEVKPLPVVTTVGAVAYCDFPSNVQLPTPNLTPGIWSGAGVVDINNGLFNSQVAGGLGYNGADTTYTLFYTHTDVFGCSNSANLDVNITYGDSVLAGPDRIICIDDAPLTLNGFSPLGGTWAGTGITDPAGIFDPSTVVAGAYYPIYTQGAGTCVKSDTIEIIVIDVTGTTAGADEEFCYEDGLVTLTGQSPLGGIWTGPGVQDGSLGTFLTQSVSTGVTSDTVQICYTYTDALSGCDYTDCKNVVINPLPVVGFTAVDTSCVNSIVNFTNTSVDAISFKWLFGDGDSSLFLSPTHSYDTSGLYTITLIAYSDKGCPDTTTQEILIYEIPQANFALSNDDGCGPLMVSFTNLTTAQDQNLTYSWDFGNGLTSAQQNPPAQSYNAGVEDTIYVISLTVSNLCGVTTYTDSIIVRPEPVVFFVADDNYGCGPLTVNFSNATTGGPNSYLWDFGNGQTSTDTVPPPIVFTINDTIPVTFTVTLTATNACGTDVMTMPITVIPGSVNAGIGTDVTAGCQPLTVNFTSAVQMGDNVQWIFGDGNGSVLENPSHTFDTVGTFTVYQIVTNQCGADTATVLIEVYPQPTMSFNHLPYTCVGDAMQFNNTSTPIAGTLWEFGDGTSSTLTNPTHVYNAPGLYTVYITNYSVTYLCPRVDSTVVEVKANPNASFTPDVLNGCAPLTVNLTNLSSGQFQSWYFSDTNSTITNNPTHTFQDDGQYFITLTTTDGFGCSTDTTVTGFVAYPKPVADFEPSAEVQCGLDATVTMINTSIDADAYFWDFGNGTFSNVTTPVISYNNQGDHTIELQASNTFGCTDTIQKVFTTYPSPIADFDLSPQAGCEPLPVQFTQLALNTDGYFWRFGDGETSTEANPIHVYSQGIYNVTFVASLDDKCFDSIVIVDAVFAEGSPVADFEVIELSPDDPTGVLLFNNLTTGATSYEWEFGDGTFSNEESPTKEYLENGQRIVRMIAFNDEGCSDTLIKVIQPTLFKGLFVPNAFSPDAGIGDVRVFRPVGVGIQDYRVQVFAQWGELLWESEALDEAGRPTESWDGMYNGTAMPQGAYVWKVYAVFRDGSQWEGQENTLGQTKRLGSVTLLR